MLRNVLVAGLSVVAVVAGCSDGEQAGSPGNALSAPEVLTLPQQPSVNPHQPRNNAQPPSSSDQAPQSNDQAPQSGQQPSGGACPSLCSDIGSCLDMDCSEFCLGYDALLSVCPAFGDAITCVLNAGVVCSDGEFLAPTSALGGQLCRSEIESLVECLEEFEIELEEDFGGPQRDRSDGDGPPFGNDFDD